MSGGVFGDGVYSDEELARIDEWRPRPGDPSAGVGSGIARITRTTVSGAVLAGVMTHLGDLLEGRPVRDRPAIVREDAGEPEPIGPVLLRFDPSSPQGTVAHLRDEGVAGTG